MAHQNRSGAAPPPGVALLAAWKVRSSHPSGECGPCSTSTPSARRRFVGRRRPRRSLANSRSNASAGRLVTSACGGRANGSGLAAARRGPAALRAACRRGAGRTTRATGGDAAFVCVTIEAGSVAVGAVTRAVCGPARGAGSPALWGSARGATHGLGRCRGSRARGVAATCGSARARARGGRHLQLGAGRGLGGGGDLQLGPGAGSGRPPPAVGAGRGLGGGRPLQLGAGRGLGSGRAPAARRRARARERPRLGFGAGLELDRSPGGQGATRESRGRGRRADRRGLGVAEHTRARGRRDLRRARLDGRASGSQHRNCSASESQQVPDPPWPVASRRKIRVNERHHSHWLVRPQPLE